MADVVMPQLGETVTEATITRWYKQVGESVEIDETLFEVSTDKVDSEMPSPATGVLSQIVVAEGETVDVGTVIAVIAANVETHNPAVEPSAPTPEPVAEPPVQPARRVSEPPVEPVGRVSEPAVEPVGRVSEPAVEPVGRTFEPAVERPITTIVDNANEFDEVPKRILSPVVRRMVKEFELDVNAIVGTGVGGRITRSDVQRVVDQKQTLPPEPLAPSVEAPIEPLTRAVAPPAAPAPTPTAPTVAPAAAPMPAPTTPAGPPAAPAPTTAPAATPTPGREQVPTEQPVVSQTSVKIASASDQIVDLDRIRQHTGQYLKTSQAEPHVYSAIEVDYERIEQVRKQFSAGFEGGQTHTIRYFSFVARALLGALRDYPALNASLHENRLTQHSNVNLGFEVDLNHQGQISPVIRSAQTMRLYAIDQLLSDLSYRARLKQVSQEELTAATITLVDTTDYGTAMRFPIINHPQVAIVSIGSVERKPVVVADEFGNESIVAHSVGLIGLAWNQRAFDGAYAAGFLRRIRDIIETRDWRSELG